MGIFHPTGVSVSSKGKRNSDYVAFRPYCAIVAPTLLPQKQRDAFLAKMGKQTKTAPKSESARSSHQSIRILFLALAVLAVVVVVLGLLWRLQLL